MGSNQSTKRALIIGGGVGVSLLGLWVLRAKAQTRKMQAQVDLLDKTRRAESASKLFTKDMKYWQKCSEIQDLIGAISSSPNMDLATIKEFILKVDQLTHDHINPLIIHLEQKSYLKRRKVIKNLKAYIAEILENLEMCESVAFLYMGEILKDAEVTNDEFLRLNHLLMEEDMDFLNQMGAINEKNRIMQSPMPQDYIFLKDAVVFFQKKIATLERVRKDSLFKTELDFNMSQIGIVLQYYITDLVVIETKIEEFDILRRVDLMNNAQIQQLQKSFLEKFLRFTEQLKTSGGD